ncbi:hypothetical protein NEOLEDRAFT_1174229 [Neolentinus lepideus HHB14362 ss-1]|uniref:RRM domain-containing protein n=1 Tax=Neolentinus lepideus HHB14362 ss-1 TaxID=1314782 RepID=A0A165W9C3_9AGAM|nr:hypothetical protein NEOLEDRAFT_1174229 [Neolentinus lepideus HHB14362 ss-1]
MPHKQTAKPRAWGTRFDSLDSSPPSSPPSQDTPAFGTDTKDQTPESPTIRKKEDRMPHDASVFVGSLPTHVEHQELTGLLSEHLSQYAEVKNIKVVRDSKGGVCAFVQCEDAAAAARLIHTLQTTPCEPFMGRTLRFEPARAFRTLLISFRAPIQLVPSGAEDDFAASAAYQESLGVQLDLPVAIRFWRPRGAKYVSVLYNDEACQFDAHIARSGMVNHDSGANDAFAGAGVFLCPIKFDKEAILKIASAFGKVEQFSPYSPPTDRFDATIGSYPFPHDAPRASSMDTGCWQVKWGHRDDCVNALMTLRRIPFLTVTWAHQPSSSVQDHQQVLGSPTIYHSTRSAASGLFLAGATYPLYVQLSHYTTQMPGYERQDCRKVNSNEYQRQGECGYASTAFGGGRLRTVTESSGGTVLSSPLSRRPVITGLGGLESSPGMEFLKQDGARKIDWSETEFPPLGEQAASTTNRDDSNVQGSNSCDGRSNRLPPTPRGLGHPLSQVVEAPETPTRRDAYSDTDTSVPPTPDFVTSPITPRTPGFSVLHTPVSHDNSLGEVEHEASHHDAPYGGPEARKFTGESGGMQVKNGFERHREVDPTTIFIGGLEMFGPNAWDEQRVRTVFERFGGIEDVRVVKPLNKRSAFAFVRFDNTEAPARAVAEEHNRIYDGRQIRVQLRDNNSHRNSSTFKYGRGGRMKGYQCGARPGFGSSGILGLDLGKDRFNEPRRDEELGRGPMNMPSHAVDRDTSGATVASAELQFPSISCSTSDTANTEGSSVDSLVRSEKPPMSPPPSSVGSSVSSAVPVTPYPVAPIGYYPGPWMSGFGQPWHYPVPYMTGYTAPPPSGAQTPHSYPGTPGSSDASGPTAQPSWMGMYRPFIPYAPYPVQHEITQAQFPAGQPPLRPTGFVQNEHGMLVPVYQPEALGQYMSNGRDSNPSLATSTSSDGQATALHWPQPTPPVMCPQPGFLLPVPGVPGHGQSVGPSSWPTQPTNGWSSGQQSHPVVPVAEGTISGGPPGIHPIRGPHSQPTMTYGSQPLYFQQHGGYAPGHQKRQPRRGNQFINGRNHSRRSSPDRFARSAGPTNNTLEHSRLGQNHVPSINPDLAVPQTTMQMNGEWSRWANGGSQV